MNSLKKQIIASLLVALSLSACVNSPHSSSDSQLSIQDQKQKYMQCHELKHMMATGNSAQEKAAYRESKALGCGN